VKDMREKFEKEGFIEYLDHGLLEMPSDESAGPIARRSSTLRK
jgi:hypothetical protein